MWNENYYVSVNYWNVATRKSARYLKALEFLDHDRRKKTRTYVDRYKSRTQTFQQFSSTNFPKQSFKNLYRAVTIGNQLSTFQTKRLFLEVLIGNCVNTNNRLTPTVNFGWEIKDAYLISFKQKGRIKKQSFKWDL